MTLTPNSQGQYIDAAAPLPTQTLESKLRQRRSTFAERSKEYKNKRQQQQQQQQDTSQLKRNINPKTGSSPSSPSPSASQTQESAPKWTAIAHF